MSEEYTATQDEIVRQFADSLAITQVGDEMHRRHFVERVLEAGKAMGAAQSAEQRAGIQSKPQLTSIDTLQAYFRDITWDAWPRQGFEMIEHSEPELSDFYIIRHKQTGKVIRQRVPQQEAFMLIGFSYDVILETMDAYAENRRSLRSSQEDSEPGQPGEAGR